MSFQEQERVLFDLLFNREVREDFIENNLSAFKKYDLTEEEKQDFLSIRTDALAADASIRCSIILNQLGKYYPISFCLLSTINGGLNQCTDWIDSELMLSHITQRPVLFGQRMQQWLAQQKINPTILAIQEAELSMAWTRDNLISSPSTHSSSEPTSLEKNWEQRPLEIGEFVSAALLPRPYADIKRTLCPCPESKLWRHLQKTPLQYEQIQPLLESQTQHLLVARAIFSERSLCDPHAHHITLQLSEGFAPLFQHFNGQHSTADLLLNLQANGAPTELLRSIRRGFEQLIQHGMLIFAE